MIFANGAFPPACCGCAFFVPFPPTALRHALANRKKVVVLDRNCSFGHHGIFHQEIKSALYDLPPADRPVVRGIVAGLGGRDITPRILEQMLLLAWKESCRSHVLGGTRWRKHPAEVAERDAN